MGENGMPWPGAIDKKKLVIAEAKLYWQYETPFPDIADLNEEILSRDVYGRLRIPYDESHRLLVEVVEKYSSEWAPKPQDDGISFCTDPTVNLSYPEYDAFILHAFVRHFQPTKIIELGSGMSTRAMASAGQMNANPPQVTCVDKYAAATTKDYLGRLNVTFLEADIISTELGLYESLGENDILFIDSSHVLKNYGDVEYEFMTILPSLKRGVIVHVHDIFLPFNYPKPWLTEWLHVLTEQQVLGAYLHDNPKVKILSANHFNAVRGAYFPSSISSRSAGSFWFQIL